MRLMYVSERPDRTKKYHRTEKAALRAATVKGKVYRENTYVARDFADIFGISYRRMLDIIRDMSLTVARIGSSNTPKNHKFNVYASVAKEQIEKRLLLL